MAISSALNAALSGLTVTARRAEIVSSNIANAATPGYARREVAVQSDARSSGVQVVDIRRQSDLILTMDRRSSSASAGAADYLAAQLLRIERAYGTPGDSAGLNDAVAALDGALIAASAAPDSTAALAAVAAATKDLTNRFAEVSDVITRIRAEADAAIASDVASLNSNLSRIAGLDRQIVAERAAGRDTASLLDQRQSIVDRVAEIIPLREVARPDGRPALIALNGAVLLDGRPAQFGFAPAPVITASGSALLSGLSLNGQAVSTDTAGLIGGGALAARFTLRDNIAPEFQAGLDALALDLATRLRDADPTLSPTSPGLLTDAGRPVDGSLAAGLSGRLQLNALSDPDADGDLRYLRDGFAAASPGPVGDGRQLRAFQAALAEPAPLSIPGRAAELLDALSSRRTQAEDEASRTAARATTLAEAEAARGVNTDSELQDLMQIEKAYAANARVLQVVDGLLQSLLEI